MKKIKILLLSISLLVTFSVFSANMDVRFTNMKISGSNLVYDIEVRSTTAGTYVAGMEFYINYSSAGFGTNIAASVIADTTGSFLNGSIFYSLNKQNNAATRLKLSVFNYSGANRVEMPTDFSKIYTVTMPILNVNNNAGINLQISLMGSGQIYYLAASGGTPVLYTSITGVNNLLTLPLNPNLALLLSEIGDPSDLGTDSFIEVYNAGATTVDFTNHYEWYVSTNGASSTQLTGTLAPGATYLLDITGTSGTSDFLLSTYGDFVDGTSIDVYDGGLTGFDFTGKHAVRHYNIISPNATFTTSEWVISDAQDMDMTAGSHRLPLTWNGASSEWRNNANWGGFIPDAGHNVVINAGITPVISNGDNAYAHDLTIGSAGLKIESLPGADGSLITYGTVSGAATVERFLGADRYWYVTQPVTFAEASVFLHTWMFTYGGGAWSAFIEDEGTDLEVMKGYAVWTSSSNKYDQDLPPLGDTTTAYNGTLNTGDISTGLTTGFNFVGNPYTSAVDWDATTGWTRVNLATNTYYVWTGTTYASYIVGGPGTNGGTQFIPAAQGFFVNASAAGSLGVSNTVRTHSTQDFWKSGENRMNLLSLTVSNGNVNDETVIYFNEEATQELDYSFDALKLMAEAAPQAYTLMGTEKMSINTFNNINETNKVTLGVNAPEAGDYTITASNLESFDASIPVYLEDVVTGQKVDLREMSTYAFNTGEGMSERFVVHFAEYAGLGDNAASEVTSIYAVDQNVYVDFNANKGEIAIYNILGMEISRTGASNGLNMISVPQGNAVYIVKVIADNTTVTKKVFVK